MSLKTLRIMDCKKQYQMPLYRLKHDIPLMRKGAIFYYNAAEGCLKLAWTKDGNCQQNFCADTIVFHEAAMLDNSWFEPFEKAMIKDEEFEETEIAFNGEKLYRKI